MRYVSPTGFAIIGTLERITGVAHALDYDENGDPEYDGETTVWWDEQETAVDAKGRTIYVDEEGGQWPWAELTADEDGTDTDHL